MVPSGAVVDAVIAYSSSTYCVVVSTMPAVCEEVSFTPALGVRKVVFSFVTPPVATAIFVVLFPSVMKVELNISKTPPAAPTSVHPLAASHEPVVSAYSSRYCIEGVELLPSLDTSIRRRAFVPG